MDKKEKEVKLSADERQFFVATRMSLPLFMLSRNRLREDNLESVQKQFKLAGGHYNAYCQQENRREEFSAATYNHYRHVTGFEKTPATPYPPKRPLRSNREMTTWRGYQHAPNRYGVLPEPYKSRMGSKGSVFAKMHVNKSRVSIKPPPPKFYEVPSEIERFFRPENKQKGIFLTNARERRPSSRLMVSDATMCWRNPSDPGPCETYYNRFEIQSIVSPKIIEKPDNPHLFLRHSCVPTKRSRILRPHISFEPCPGRYDIRYPNVCACERGKKTVPRLTIHIETQKRYKFRRLPYVKIRMRKYCEPDWRHVIGKGHRRLFKMGKHDLPKPQMKKVEKKGGKKVEKQLKMFADAKYLNMLVNPRHLPISTRDFPAPPYVPRIVYNCIAKRVIRKQLRNNKKIAFMSGQERWKDGVRVLQMTQRQLEEIKARLPEDRRLEDRPINLRASKMLSRLFIVPDRMRTTYVPMLRKRLFKFLPIPGARVLVTDSDIRPDLPFDRDNPTGMYNVKIDETKFFRDSVLLEMEQQRLGIKVQVEEKSLEQSMSGVSMTASMASGSQSEQNTARLTNYMEAKPDE
ncbi:uncharacterized protein LOC6580400 [Drosophila mojavensis]|uniref:Uncharacterized protein n=1 Tax=Drosophila mojavensis TaxID=7230 RepID=B4KPI0_DROMO|nr:uncharacterized protein LOC6580400 [Drosophila mojavensis]EDW10176.1 uncharacterized protein Dmoj_GI20936 [Drosophila mojavensis]